jgi:HEPN domain-containing protein
MKPHVEEALRSLRLADRDIKAFEVLADEPDVHLSMACFHAQQAVEKSSRFCSCIKSSSSAYTI